jgi:hypothetical protein
MSHLTGLELSFLEDLKGHHPFGQGIAYTFLGPTYYECTIGGSSSLVADNLSGAAKVWS